MNKEEANAAVGKQVRTAYRTRGGNLRKPEYQLEGVLARTTEYKQRHLGLLRYPCELTRSGYTSSWVPIKKLETLKQALRRERENSMYAPVWILSLLGLFFQVIGDKARAETRRRQAREKKRLKALAKAKQKLAMQKIKRNAEIKAEALRVKKSVRVRKELRAQIVALQVPGENGTPYAKEEFRCEECGELLEGPEAVCSCALGEPTDLPAPEDQGESNDAG